MTGLLDLLGVPVHLSEACCLRKQVRFPRTRKQRIQKKWAKQSRNFTISPDPSLYEVNTSGMHYFIGHPVTVKRMCDAVQRQQEEWAEKWAR